MTNKVLSFNVYLEYYVNFKFWNIRVQCVETEDDDHIDYPINDVKAFELFKLFNGKYGYVYCENGVGIECMRFASFSEIEDFCNAYNLTENLLPKVAEMNLKIARRIIDSIPQDYVIKYWEHSNLTMNMI